MEFQKRRDCEFDYLKQMVESGNASGPQLARFTYLLENRDSTNRKNAVKLCRTLQTAYIHRCLDALKLIVRSTSINALGEKFANLLMNSTKVQLLQFALWVRDMKPSERRLLDQIVAAYRRYGSEIQRPLGTQ